MNRAPYFNYIEEKLHVLSRRIETRGKLNLLDLHIHLENFFFHFFNLLYGYKLENLNRKSANIESIDLICHKNKIIIQVSATSTKQKIESALSKDIIKNYNNYTFKFISISKDASNLRKKKYKNEHSIKFDCIQDIYDTKSILNDILNYDIEKIKKIYSFIKKELGNEIDIVKLDSNLAAIINILSKERWDEANKSDIVNSFEIDRKISFNNLKSSKEIIREYFVYYGKVDEKYYEFDSKGVNKSNSVLASIKREYLKIKDKTDADLVFSSIIESVIEKILRSANFEAIPIDELELCVDIIVVDAFTRCKIFNNPEGYNYVVT